MSSEERNYGTFLTRCASLCEKKVEKIHLAWGDTVSGRHETQGKLHQGTMQTASKG
ncbi:hypothetical protein [Aquabacterium sp. NJ1]|uniref:hypothetical protein n=1 Tax=Aquabacterium sp. NJ1 TaxID=1538295 RepID=UPI001377D682|nr:hypothetical protein [Aquabacterium sp. NJ1]